MMPRQNYEDFDGRDNSANISFNKQQKIGLSILLLFTVLIVAMWYWQLKKSIIYPLYGGISPAELVKQTAKQDAEALAKSQSIDTDKDGLSDFDEITIYKTSPFLADTDGDGLSDKEEIEAGSDPNCPEGKDCSDLNLLAAGNTGIPAELLIGAATGSPQSGGQLNLQMFDMTGQNSAIAVGQISNAGLSQTGAASLRQAFGNNPDPEVLRQQFLAAASQQTDKEMIESMNNEQLLQLYQIMIAGN